MIKYSFRDYLPSTVIRHSKAFRQLLDHLHYRLTLAKEASAERYSEFTDCHGCKLMAVQNRAQKHSEQAGLTFALVPRWQRRAIGHWRGGEVGGGAVHLVGEGAVGQTLLFVPLADEARQGELVVGGQAGGVAEALRPRGAVLLDGTRLQRDRRQRRQWPHQTRNKSLFFNYGQELFLVVFRKYTLSS